MCFWLNALIDNKNMLIKYYNFYMFFILLNLLAYFNNVNSLCLNSSLLFEYKFLLNEIVLFSFDLSI